MSTKTRLSPVDHELQQLKVFVRDLFPNPDSLIFMVPEAVQQQELRAMQQGLRAEQFFMVVDFANLKITEAAGLEEIGYNSAQFAFRQYLSTIPTGGMMQLVILLGKQTVTLSKRSLLTFLSPKFVAHIPLTAADGRVLLVKRTISPWQFTSTGRVTTYISEFTILKPYESEPMHPRFINLEPGLAAELNNEITKLFAHLPAKENPFSHREMALLKLYADSRYEDATAKGIADLSGIQLNTVHTHSKNILVKARAMFGETLPARSARDVAQFLKKCGFLGLIP